MNDRSDAPVVVGVELYWQGQAQRDELCEIRVYWRTLFTIKAEANNCIQLFRTSGCIREVLTYA